jgi:hypothetical protein
MTSTAFAPCVPDPDIAGVFVARRLRIGLEFYAAGNIERAISAYRYGLAVAAGNESSAHVDRRGNCGAACQARKCLHGPG